MIRLKMSKLIRLKIKPIRVEAKRKFQACNCLLNSPGIARSWRKVCKPRSTNPIIPPETACDEPVDPYITTNGLVTAIKPNNASNAKLLNTTPKIVR